MVRLVDNQAKIYFDEHVEGETTTFGDENHRPEIDRGPLRNLLLDSLQPETVVWNSHVLTVEQLQDTWKLVFENGSSINADIVIGTDGAKSKIRPFVTDINPFWTGITILEGSIKDSAKTAPNIHKLLKGGKIFSFGNDKTLHVSSIGDGSINFLTGCKTEEFWDKKSRIDFKDRKQVLAFFKEEYSEWSPDWQELFEHEATTFIPRPQYCTPLNQKWEAKPNITLIGDAAHWMPPFAGEGVNIAMQDALQLSEALTNPALADIQHAIASYEKQMFTRFEKVGQLTLFNTKWMHRPKALNMMLSLYSKSSFKQLFFVSRYLVNVIAIPFAAKILRLKTQANGF